MGIQTNIKVGVEMFGVYDIYKPERQKEGDDRDYRHSRTDTAPQRLGYYMRKQLVETWFIYYRTQCSRNQVTKQDGFEIQ